MAVYNCNAISNIQYSLLGNKYVILRLESVQNTSLLVVLIVLKIDNIKFLVLLGDKKGKVLVNRKMFLCIQ